MSRERSEAWANEAMRVKSASVPRTWAPRARKSEPVWLISGLVVIGVISTCALVGYILAGGGRSILSALGV
jgi:hypothetical protein